MNSPVGELLRAWRMRSGLSQLALSAQSGISTRHISFVETGRTVPSTAMIERFADNLNIPLRERNQLHLAAGALPIHPQRTLDDPDLAAATTAVRRVVACHAPYPAVAVDARWNLLFANDAAEIFFDGASPELLTPPVNMMRLGLHPDGFGARLTNHAQVSAYLLPRLARQAERSGDPVLVALHTELRAFAPAADSPVDPADVALPIRLAHDDTELSFFNTITTFGAAFDITLAEIAVESYFPADAHTAEYLHRRALPAQSASMAATPSA
ncbi:helix-turn-helix transcriptional regulator [Nocardia sp. NPDC050718]|uniref:helix-turn-helix domain-containing protein n=1 Tax=Nocardia sp. NPDC050718 TaxID=3155788 RepID=UPI0033E0B034